jgi:hypothetical protein
MLGVKPRDLPGADVLRAEFEWNAMLSDLTNRRNEFEVVLRERWDALDVKPKGNYSAKNSLTMATGACNAITPASLSSS